MACFRHSVHAKIEPLLSSGQWDFPWAEEDGEVMWPSPPRFFMALEVEPAGAPPSDPTVVSRSIWSAFEPSRRAHCWGESLRISDYHKPGSRGFLATAPD